MGELVIETELHEYLQVRHAKIEPSPASSPDSTSSSSKQPSQQPLLPSKFYKHWTQLWVVLHLEISPNYSYIGYCKKEADWLSDSQTIAKCFLDEKFTVERPPPGYSKKYEYVLQLVFKGYRLDLGFDSMTKLDQWFKALQVCSDRHHVDLVRCHEHPQLEKEYVVQVCTNSYLVWNPAQRPCAEPLWEWHLKHIRRVHWHKNVNKLEVEPGRSSDTGEGHFYFTGRHAYRLFIQMKQMMSSHSKISSNSSSPLVASPLPSRASHTSPNGFVRPKGEGAGSGSESDWTGTGDDWTGASSDSAFINYIRSRHQFGSTEHARFGPSNSDTPSPPPPHRSASNDGIYTNLDPRTLNQDNQYCSIDRLQIHPVAGKAPSAMRNPSPNRTPLDSMAELGESLNEEDEYCKMVPNAVVRSGLGPAKLAKGEETPPPVPYPKHRQGRSSFDSPHHTPSHAHLPPLPGSGFNSPMHRRPLPNSPMHRQPLPQVGNSEML